jgi:phosphatidylglycerophosphate synthase
MTGAPWDQRLARVLVRPLVGTPIRPNHITTLSLALALGAGALYGTGEAVAANWAAALFVLARFLDHADGELARLTSRASRFGHHYDFAVGGLSSAALFMGIGVGLRQGIVGEWSLAAGIAAGSCALIAMALGLGVEARQSPRPGTYYPAFGGFELEDGIYLVAPLTWLGALLPFFVLAATGQVVFCLWMLHKFVRARRTPAFPPSRNGDT